ncbi:MAG: alcohol dehydrogenase catalytic domain-containing protein [Phycisphaerae bacterium]|nr:alcohol dehydrogenase catalytic domain-containing protein [Phycisphaerae bacterium]
MKAVRYNISPFGWATCQWLKHIWPGCLLSSLNGLSLRDVPPPELPAKDWVRVRTLLGGICGTDTAILGQKPPPDSLLQAYSSMPMILGHENVAVVDQVGPNVDRSWIGRRVMVEPTLACEARGTNPLCERCAAGEFGACENFSGDMGGTANLPPGTSIGYNRRTGGSWGEYFVAHQSQLVPVAEEISDEEAVLVDPLSCSLHGVLMANLSGVRRVLVYGAGMLGLGVIAGLRAMGYHDRIEVLDRVPYLADIADAFGANEYFTLPADPRSRFGQIAGRTGGTVQRARFGNYMISGGYDLVFDCVGTMQSVDECLKWTRARGQLVMLGTLQGKHVDLTPLWFRELRILGAYGRQLEHQDGRRVGTYPLVQELLRAGKIKAGRLLTHTFRLDEYKKALQTAMHKEKHEAIKVAFDFR